jgi:hypothetical protein
VHACPFSFKKNMSVIFSTDTRRKAGKQPYNALFRKAQKAVYTALGQGGYYRFGNQFLKEFKLDRCISGVAINGLPKILIWWGQEEGLRLRAGSIQGTA